MYSTNVEHYEIARRAERLRSAYMARILATLPKAAFGLVKRGLGAVAGCLDRAQAAAELSALSDRELHDIGISRSQIGAVVRGFDPRGAVAEATSQPRSDQNTQNVANVVSEIEVALPANQEAAPAPAARDLDKAA